MKGLEPGKFSHASDVLFETAIAFAIVGGLVLWFGIYLWRERRDR